MFRAIYICLFFFILNVDVFSSAIDYGINGAQYEIAEEDFYSAIQKRLDSLKEEDIKKQLINNIYESLKSSIDIFMCSVNQKDYIEEDYILAPIDVVLPSGDVLAKKGERVVIPDNINLPDATLCLVDGKDENKMIDDINQLYKQNNNCNFILNNYSIDNFKKKFPHIEKVYILNDALVRRFKIKCLPTRLELHGNKTYHYFLKESEYE